MSDSSAGKQAATEKAAPVIPQAISPELGPTLAGPQADLLALQGDAGNEAVTAALNDGNGRSLDSQTRAFMESHFGRSFNQVRVHTGENAVRANSALQSDAFAYGQNIWFNRGQYNPTTETGKHLLAHELAHTIQQRAGAVEPQTKITVGTSHNPAETKADLAADAVLGNGRLPTLNRVTPMIRRKPTVTKVQGKTNQYIVETKGSDTQSSKRYRVTRNVEMVKKTETYRSSKGPSLKGKINKDNVWIQVDWCEGQTKGEVKVGADIPKQAQQLLKNTGQAIIGKKDPDIDTILKGVNITPFVSVTITQSGEFRFSAKGELTASPLKKKVTRGAAKLDLDTPVGRFSAGVSAGEVPGTGRTDIRPEIGYSIPLGSVPKVSCPRRHRVQLRPKVTYTCEEWIPPHPVTRTRTVKKTKSVYLYYHYAKPELEKDPRMPGKALNDKNLPELYALLQSRWQVNRIAGYASPEGPLEQRPGSKFQGNRKLSEERALAAKNLIAEKCKPSLLDMRQRPSCFTDDFQTVVGNELYSPAPDESGKEVKGTPLAKASVGSFLSEENKEREARHRTPELEKKLEARKNSPQKQAELVYPLLRRAEINLTRQETEKYQETIEGKWQSKDPCPTNVVRAVEDSLEKVTK